jgi:hypothetical protein
MWHLPPGGWCKPMSSDIRQPLTTVGETTGSFPGRVRKGPPGKSNPLRPSETKRTSMKPWNIIFKIQP